MNYDATIWVLAAFVWGVIVGAFVVGRWVSAPVQEGQ